MAGSDFGAFGAGLAKSLGQIILGNRQEQQRKRERQEDVEFRNFQSTFPVIFKNFQDNPTPEAAASLEDMLVKFNPELGKQIKRSGFSFQTLGPLLSQQQPHTEMNEAGLPREVEASQTLPARSGAMVGMPDPTVRFFGAPVLTADQKLDQTLASQRKVDASTMQRARDVLAEMRKTRPESTIEDAFRVVGVELPSPLIEVSPGASIYNRTTGKAEFTAERPATPGQTEEFDLFLQTYAKERGKSVDPRAPNALTAQDRLDAQQAFAKARHVGSGADASQDINALAEMAANNPAIMQSTNMTPTVAGGVMAAIARNPRLRTIYEQKRLEPIRAQATRVLTSIKGLLEVSEAGDVIGLTPGARDIYGAGPGRLTSFRPGSPGANARAALNQITGQLALDLIAEMKAQSKTGATGFGQLNLQELALLESSASTLKNEISEKAALDALKDLYTRYQKILQPGEAENPNALSPPAGAIDLNTPIFIGPDGRPSLTPPAASAGGGR